MFVPLLAFALLPAPSAFTVSERPEDLLREAKHLRYAQRNFEAAACYRRFLAEQPASPRIAEARFWLAATLEQDQRWDEAAAAYSDFLAQHPEQRLLGREAKLNRVRCWGLRQGQQSDATPGLVAALSDPVAEVRVAAALQLAKVGDKRAVEPLKLGLALPPFADACATALTKLGLKTAEQPQAPRFLVMRIKEARKADAVTIRLSLALARALENYLSDSQVQEARRHGVDLDRVSERAANLPKGSVLFSVEDKESTVTVTVE